MPSHTGAKPLVMTGMKLGMIAMVIFALSYLAFSLPVVIAGVATTHFGLHRTALVYSGTVSMVAAFAAASFISRRPPVAPHT